MGPIDDSQNESTIVAQARETARQKLQREEEMEQASFEGRAAKAQQ